MDTLNLLPVLGEKGDEEVDSEDKVGLDLLNRHGDVSNGNTEAEGLLGLELELDGSLGLVNLLGDIIVGVKDGRELTSLVKTRTEETGDLTNEGGGGNESVVLVGKILDLFLVFVEELEVILRHSGDTGSLGVIDVVLVTDDADGELLTGDVRKNDGTRETLLLIGVVVLEAELKLDSLGEVTLLLLRVLEDRGDSLLEEIAGNLATNDELRLKSGSEHSAFCVRDDRCAEPRIWRKPFSSTYLIVVNALLD